MLFISTFFLSCKDRIYALRLPVKNYRISESRVHVRVRVRVHHLIYKYALGATTTPSFHKVSFYDIRIVPHLQLQIPSEGSPPESASRHASNFGNRTAIIQVCNSLTEEKDMLRRGALDHTPNLGKFPTSSSQPISNCHV
jgi:hypothetical protein